MGCGTSTERVPVVKPSTTADQAKSSDSKKERSKGCEAEAAAGPATPVFRASPASAPAEPPKAEPPQQVDQDDGRQEVKPQPTSATSPRPKSAPLSAPTATSIARPSSASLQRPGSARPPRPGSAPRTPQSLQES